MRHLAILCSVAAAASLSAQDGFPLPASAAPGSTNGVENTAPFLAPFRTTQTKVTDYNTLTSHGLATSLINWDMSAFDLSSRFVFVPAEAGSHGGGVFRYDTVTGNFATLLLGNDTGVRTPNPAVWNANNDDYLRFDPCTWTPNGTILVGEETTGGRLFEVLNPLSPAGPFQVRWLTKVPAVSHEGTRFDRDGNLYVVDEDNSGCIYKYVPSTPGDLSAGQTFVLSVDGYAADPNAMPNENWNSTQNRLTNRFGPAHWVPLTDAAGNPLTATDPFVYVTANSGRAAADEILGTPYGRPEDMDLNTLANGNQAIYVSITSENRVISIELTGSDTAIVREFVNFDTINLATGTDVNPAQNDPYTSAGSGTVFDSPDNVAADAFGNIYVVEDGEPNGGDIWKCIDANRDGVAESMGIFVSLGIIGSEPTGLIFDPNDPYRFIVNVQHPASGNNAMWSFRTRPYPGSNHDVELASGVNSAPRTGPGEFVKTANGGDAISVRFDSPDDSLTFAPFAGFLQPFPTSSQPTPFLPPLWISPFQPILLLNGGNVGGFQFILPPGGTTTSLRVPSGLGGVSVLVQGVAITPTGALVMTDAHEIVLH